MASPGEAPVEFTGRGACLPYAARDARAGATPHLRRWRRCGGCAPQEKRLPIERWCLLVCLTVASASALLSSAWRSLLRCAALRRLCSFAFSFASFIDFFLPEPCPPTICRLPQVKKRSAMRRKAAERPRRWGPNYSLKIPVSCTPAVLFHPSELYAHRISAVAESGYFTITVGPIFG